MPLKGAVRAARIAPRSSRAGRVGAARWPERTFARGRDVPDAAVHRMPDGELREQVLRRRARLSEGAAMVEREASLEPRTGETWGGGPQMACAIAGRQPWIDRISDRFFERSKNRSEIRSIHGCRPAMAQAICGPPPHVSPVRGSKDASRSTMAAPSLKRARRRKTCSRSSPSGIRCTAASGTSRPRANVRSGHRAAPTRPARDDRGAIRAARTAPFSGIAAAGSPFSRCRPPGGGPVRRSARSSTPVSARLPGSGSTGTAASATGALAAWFAPARAGRPARTHRPHQRIWVRSSMPQSGPSRVCCRCSPSPMDSSRRSHSGLAA